MQTIGDDKRLQLFELYSNNLQYVKQHPSIHIEPDTKEGYLCPQCFKFFDREALSKEYDDHLTLEDVPPKQLGGKVRLLTCKVCNNRSGTRLDSQLANKLNFDEFLSGIPSAVLDGRMRLSTGTNVTTTIRTEGTKNIHIQYHNSRSNPIDVAELEKQLKTGHLSEFDLTFYGKFRENQPEVALIRIAYLLAFSVFGYGFLINFNLQHIRYQIRHPNEKILPHWGIMTGDNFPEQVLGVNIIHAPKELRSFLVVFDLKTSNRTTRYGVILPGPSHPGLAVYATLASLEMTKSVEFNINHIQEENYLSDPNSAFISHYFWEQITSVIE